MYSKRRIKCCLSMLLIMTLICAALTVCIFAASGDFTPTTGVSVVVTDANSTSLSNGAVTMTAKGSGIFMVKATSATAKIYNNSGSKAQIKFNWNATSVNKLEIDGVVQSGTTSSYSKVLGDGEFITVKITTAANRTENKLVMSSFEVTAAKDASKVTFNFDSALGSVVVGEEAVSTGAVLDIPVTGVTVTATAKSGTTFYGWIGENGARLATSTTMTLTPATDMTVEAVFVSNTSTEAWYLAGGTHLFNEWDAAMTHASAAQVKTVVLMRDATLSEGTYTVPSGVTFVVPFDNRHTTYTDTPASTTTYAKPTAYRTLTLAANAEIIVNGTMSLPAKHYAAGGGQKNAGSPSGNVGFVRMGKDSEITVNGTLYAYGFVTGEGAVTVNSTATVYENFQVMDYRGGTECLAMLSGNPGVFFLSQYYIQNIEVPTTYYSGAKEYAMTSLNVTLIGETISMVNFIGKSEALFNLTSGTLTKRYDGETDRLMVELDGDMNASSISLSLSGYPISSEDYVLAINGNMTIDINAGSLFVLGQNMAMLPGAWLNIAEGAECSVGNNELYVYDASEWGGYCGAANEVIIPLEYAPGRTGTRGTTLADQVDATILVNGTITATSGGLYTTASGANIYSTGTGVVNIKAGSKTTTNQRVQGSSYPSIAVTSARLKDENGEYVSTAGATNATTYNYDHHYYCCDVKDCEEEHGVWYAGTHSYNGTEICSCGGHAVAMIPANKTYYSSLADALGAYDGTSYVQMVNSSVEPSIDASGKTLYIDLNGKTVTLKDGETAGTLTVATLYGMDSTTNDYSGNFGSITGTVTGTVAPVYDCEVGANTGKLYVTDLTNGAYSFHRVRFGIESYIYYVKEGVLLDGLTVNALYMSDATGLGYMEKFGFGSGVNTNPVWHSGTTGLESVSNETKTVSGFRLTGYQSGLTAGSSVTVSAALQLNGKVVQNENVLTYTADLTKLQGG